MPTLDEWNVIGTWVGAIGTAGAVLYVLFRDYFVQPRLLLSFDGITEQTDTVGRPADEISRWVRVGVVNTRRGTVAKNCRAYLTKLIDHDFAPEPIAPDGFEVLPNDVRQLPWMHDPEKTWQGRDLLPGVKHCIDVLDFPNTKPLALLHTYPPWVLGIPTDCTVTIQVSAEGGRPALITLRLHWDGGYSCLRAEELENSSLPWRQQSYKKLLSLWRVARRKASRSEVN
jgi:hypothetical protein